MKGIQHAGEYDLTDLKLFTGSGEIINLSLIYQSMDDQVDEFMNH